MNWKRPQDELPRFDKCKQIFLRVRRKNLFVRGRTEENIFYYVGWYENGWFFKGNSSNEHDKDPETFIQRLDNWVSIHEHEDELTHWCEIIGIF